MSQGLNVLGAFTPCGLASVPTPSADSIIHGSEARYFLFESEASEHRLDKTALGYSTRDETYQSKVGLGADGVFAAVNAEEEILVHQNTVVWSSGGCVRKSFTLSRPIIQAMLASFAMAPSNMDESTDKPSYASDLCVLHSEGLSVFCADGRTFSVVTPYEMEKIWPLPTGLLLQRAPTKAQQTVAPINGLSVDTDESDTPTLFSLLHPLEEIRPVSFLDLRSTLAATFVPTPTPTHRTPKNYTPKTPGNLDLKLDSQLKELKQSNSEDSSINRFICAPQLRLVYSSAEVPLLVFFNTKTKLHSIWLIRKTPKTSDSILSPLNTPDPGLSPHIPPFDSFQSSFQAGYSRDLSWGQENNVPPPVHSDLRLEHLYTEIPVVVADQKHPRAVESDGVWYEGSAPATQVFLLVTPDAHLRLCFMLSEQQVLHLYQLSSDEDEDVRRFGPNSTNSNPETELDDPSVHSTLKVTRKRSLACLAAIPLRVVDPLVLRVANKNIRLCPSYLVLELDRKIALYSTNDRICECVLPSHLFKTEKDLVKTPQFGNTPGTPIIHRTPSSSHLLHLKNYQQTSLQNLTPTARTAMATPARSLLMRTPGFNSARRLQSPIIFSPMSPGSPFPANASDLDMSISALDLDMSIDQILLQASPATPLRPQRSQTLGTISLETPAKALFTTPGPAASTSALPAPTRFSAALPSGPHVVEILQPVSNRFSVLFDDGRIFRVSLKIAPSSPLVMDCFRAATHLLTHSVWNTVLSEYLAWKHKLQHTGISEFGLFAFFVQALLPITSEMAEREISNKKKTSVDPDTVIGVDDNDWNFLLNSDFHATKMKQAPYQILPISADLFGKKDPGSKSSSEQETTLSSLPSLSSQLTSFCCSDSHIDTVLKEMATWSKRPRVILLRPFVSSLVHTIHLLCENYKLSALTMSFSKQLSRLLLNMAVLQGWKIYAEFYARWLGLKLLPTIFPSSTAPKDAKETFDSAPNLPDPPSILDWMKRCLVGFRETFPVMRESNQPCELTRKLCRIYHILVHGPPQETDFMQTYFEPFSTLPISLGTRLHKTPRTSPIKSAQLKENQQLKWNVRARLAVVAMDEEFADVASLDDLPFGVALPLREAIHSVKYHPPTDWPLSCYRFIGREDLAMQGLSFQKVAKSKFSIQDPYLATSAAASQGTPSIAPTNTTGNFSAQGEHGLSNILNVPYRHRTNVTDPSSASADASAAAKNAAESESGYDGTDLTSTATLMRFSQDERLAEVARLLRSSYVLQLVATEEISHQSEAVQIHESYQKQMLFFIMRLLALPIGRGMYTLGAELDHWGNAELDLGIFDELEDARDSLHAKQTRVAKTAPTSVLKACARAEPIVVPALVLKARRPDDRSIMTVERVAGLVDWPEFHNGVAAGLRVPPSDVEPISWQWIVSNRPKTGLSSTHAGFLLAMGLHGHLRKVDPTGLYDYLSLVHPLTSASLLVGYASCMYGTRSSQLSKVLGIHLPKPKRSLGGAADPTPVDSGEEVHVPNIVQCAAIVAAGIGFAETNHRHHVESMLSLLQHPHYNPNCTESFGLSSGISLGFICLGQGNKAIGLTDLDIVNRLCACIEGSKTRTSGRSSSIAQDEAIMQAKVRTAGGLMEVLSHNPTFASNPMSTRARPVNTSALPIRIGPFDHGVPARKGKAPPNEKVETPVLVRHEHGIDKEVSAAGATIALGLIFLKTNNQYVASRVGLPLNNPSALGFIRPDVQLQRVLSKNLIMWDSVEPTPEWWDAQFPAGSLAAAQSVMGPAWKRDPVAEKQDSFQLLKTSFVMVTGGAAMSLGIRFAGCSNAACITLLSQALNQLLKIQKSMPDRVDKKLTETSILQIVLAWSLIQAGTGDLVLLRTLRKLRKKLGLDGKLAEGIYGYQMAIGMAIGFLFLGGGRYSISSSNKAVAALVTSLYCIWPLVPSDDKYHLQLLRHLYVMAVEPRCLEARDVDLLRPEFVPVRFWVLKDYGTSSLDVSTDATQVQKANQPISAATQSGSNIPKKPSSKDVEVIEMVTPCIMPPRERIVKIEIVSPQHWSAAFRPNRNKLHQHMFQVQNFFLVKKRHGSMHSAANANSNLPRQPILSASQLALSPTLAAESTNTSGALQFAGDPMLSAFAAYLMSDATVSPISADQDPSELQQWQTDVFQDQETLRLLRSCSDEDKEKLIGTLMWLRHYAKQCRTASKTPHTAPSTSDSANIELVLQFYDTGVADDYDPPIDNSSSDNFGATSLLSSFSTVDSNLSTQSLGSNKSRSLSQSSHTAKKRPAVVPIVSPSLLQLVRSAHYMCSEEESLKGL